MKNGIYKYLNKNVANISKKLLVFQQRDVIKRNRH